MAFITLEPRGAKGLGRTPLDLGTQYASGGYVHDSMVATMREDVVQRATGNPSKMSGTNEDVLGYTGAPTPEDNSITGILSDPWVQRGLALVGGFVAALIVFQLIKK